MFNCFIDILFQLIKFFFIFFMDLREYTYDAMPHTKINSNTKTKLFLHILREAFIDFLTQSKLIEITNVNQIARISQKLL